MWEIFCASIPACRVVQAPNESPSPTQDEGRRRRRRPRAMDLATAARAAVISCPIMNSRHPRARRPPRRPPAIRTVQPRSVQLGQSLVDVKLSFVIFPSSSSEAGGVTFPIHVTKEDMHFHSAAHLTFFPVPSLPLQSSAPARNDGLAGAPSHLSMTTTATMMRAPLI